MANYIRTRKNRELETQMEIDFLNKLGEVQKNVDNGILPLIRDTRTKQEKLHDKSYRDQQIRTMAYNLFDNDVEYSEKFISDFNRKQLPFTQFSSIYDELEKRFKNTDTRPAFVITTAEKLINNLNNTGNTFGSFSNDLGFNNNDIKDLLKQVRDEINDFNFRNQLEKAETVNKLNALEYLTTEIFNSKTNISFDDANKIKDHQWRNMRDKSKRTLQELSKILSTDDYPTYEIAEELINIIKDLRSDNIREIALILQNENIEEGNEE